MWILFIITILATGGEQGTPLAGYTYHAECKAEQERVQAEMYKIYPTETHKFYLQCLIQSKEVS